MASGERGEARASLTRISESLTQCREPLAWGKKPPKLPQSCGEDNGEDHIMDEIPSFFCVFTELSTSKKAILPLYGRDNFYFRTKFCKLGQNENMASVLFYHQIHRQTDQANLFFLLNMRLKTDKHRRLSPLVVPNLS